MKIGKNAEQAEVKTFKNLSLTGKMVKNKKI